jgi:hypothetical protein
MLPVVFDSEPSDQELAAFIDPFPVTSVGLRIVETPRTISGVATTIPLLFVLICELPVAGILIWLDLQGRLPAGGLPRPLLYVFASLAFAGPLVVIHFINQAIVASGKFFALDKMASTLELPRYGLALSKASIRRFVEVRGFKGGREKSWVRELTVLAETKDGHISRYAVALDSFMFSFPKRRQIGEELSEFFGVPLTQLKG